MFQLISIQRVAINTYKERNTIQAVDIEFEVSGNMVVSGISTIR